MDLDSVLFLASWCLGTIALCLLVAHSYTTGHVLYQPHLILAKLLLLVSILVAMPYDWSLNLQRYRLMADAVFIIICIALLLRSHPTYKQKN